MVIPPLKTFEPGNRVYVRAQQVWLILVAHVMSGRQALTYGDLADKMGIDRRAAIGLHRELGIVAMFCIQNDLPAITCLVVGQDTRAPGPGVLYRSGKSWQEDQRDASRIDWFKYRVPTTGTLRQVWEEMQAVEA
jgi:hypothetical protein